ncbi:MAG: DUF2851 family protein [Bacteroidaceae bacterium]|nr:DUF2851 family protein [Bacteroidaceae bacterium]
MEQLLHYTWKHRMFPLGGLITKDGKQVEVIDVGLHNYDQGPDFFNAKVKVDGEIWAGNVEIHDKSSDWYVHGHDRDESYNNVVLHVVSKVDCEVLMASGRMVAQIELRVPEKVLSNYEELFHTERYPPCWRIIPSLNRVMLLGWLTRLQAERLEQKTERIMERVHRSHGSWECACFCTIARNFGFGVNGDAFEEWAFHIPLGKVAHHRDDLFQVKAMFLGQAGLIDKVEHGKREALAAEYSYLKEKFSLRPMNALRWKYLRMRPANFPHVRIIQLAEAYYEFRTELSRIIECMELRDLRDLLNPGGRPFSKASVDLLVINSVVPLLFAYGKAMGKEELQNRAFKFLDELDAESNAITRVWKECGLEVSCAGDSQALIQQKKEYCDRKRCLHCRIGYEYLASKRL